MRRGFGAVVACAVAGALALPGVAHAAEGPDPVLVGDCAATLDDSGAAPGARPLTVDVGAGAEAPGVVTVGLGSTSKGTNGHDDPLLTAPAGDTLDGLGVTSTPVVSNVAAGVCDAVKPVVNDVGTAVQTLVPIDDITEPASGAPPGRLPPEEESPDDPPGEAPGGDRNPGGGVSPVGTGPGVGVAAGFGGLGASGGSDLPTVLDGSLDALGEITLPPAVAIDPPVRAPGLNDRAKESGTAQAVPAAGTQDRLPLLLAVIALAAAAVALGKTLHDRRPV